MSRLHRAAVAGGYACIRQEKFGSRLWTATRVWQRGCDLDFVKLVMQVMQGGLRPEARGRRAGANLLKIFRGPEWDFAPAQIIGWHGLAALTRG